MLQQLTTQSRKLKEVEEYNRALQQEINSLKSRQMNWEKGLSSLIDKLNDNATHDFNNIQSIQTMFKKEGFQGPTHNQLLFEEEYEEECLSRSLEMEAEIVEA